MEETSGKNKNILGRLRSFYDKNYKPLLIIPFLLLLAAIILTGIKIAKTGDFINRDVSLKGGVTITIPVKTALSPEQIEASLKNIFPKNDISVKSLSQFGAQKGIIIEADIEEKDINAAISIVEKTADLKLAKKDYTVEVVGSSLGQSFFREVISALVIAFVFMAVVVFLYFRTFVPSLAVILAAFSDIFVTLAIINLLGVKLSSAGIAAFLMLIGYSVDTDILLSTRVLKRKEGSVIDKVISSVKTGLTMTATAVTAAFVAFILTPSEVIKQIMLILIIGLLVDVVNTWIQNVGILRLYVERKEKQAIK